MRHFDHLFFFYCIRMFSFFFFIFAGGRVPGREGGCAPFAYLNMNGSVRAVGAMWPRCCDRHAHGPNLVSLSIPNRNSILPTRTTSAGNCSTRSTRTRSMHKPKNVEQFPKKDAGSLSCRSFKEKQAAAACHARSLRILRVHAAWQPHVCGLLPWACHQWNAMQKILHHQR